jgi:SOS-response transcriptional repressor LexA
MPQLKSRRWSRVEATTGLTPRQAEIFQIIWDEFVRSGRAFTWNEMMVCLGIRSPNGITGHVQPLIKKGFIAESAKYSRRSLVPIRTPDGRPILGWQPILEDD